MHTRLPMMSFFLCLTLSLASCGKARKGLSDADRATLKGINQTLGELAGTLNAGFAQEPIAPSLSMSDKAQKMLNQLRADGCQVSSLPPLNRFDMSWTGKRQIGPDNCSLTDLRAVVFNLQARKLSLQTSIVMNDANFAQLTGINGVLATGQISVQHDVAGTQHSVTGQIQYDHLELTGYGKLSVLLQLEEVYDTVTANNQGRLLINWALADGQAHVARAEWSRQDPLPKFSVDENEIPRKDFLELFSSFNVVEIIAYSSHMRYL